MDKSGGKNLRRDKYTYENTTFIDWLQFPV